MSEANQTPGSGYSRAFETFVEGENDLLGLLAYALYKKAIQEAFASGKSVSVSGQRHPSESEKRAYRSLAGELLDTFGVSAQNAARDSLLEGGLRPDLVALKDELISHIDRKTSWWSAFLVNIAAWIASIALTVLLAVAASAPAWVPRLRTFLGW